MAKKLPTPVVEPENPDVALVTEDAGLVQQFVGGLREHFRQALVLEMRAKQNLLRFEGFKAPTNGEEDQRLQQEIRTVNADIKEVEGHWTITSILDKLHKRAVQFRKRGTDPNTRAVEIGNRLHVTYVDNERRRARELEERNRREAEERAQRERDKELADLERAALKAEESSPTLSHREQAFVDAFMSNVTGWKGNATRAAEVAGYKDAQAQGSKLLNTPKIQKAIIAIENAARLRQQATAKREAPVEVAETVEVKADIIGGDRTFYSAEIYDADAFVRAVIAGQIGIPFDTLEPNQTKLNEHARSLRENLNRWPGVRLKKKTSVV